MQEKLRQIMCKAFKVPFDQITDQTKVETIETSLFNTVARWALPIGPLFILTIKNIRE